MISGAQKPKIPALSVTLPYFLLSSISLVVISLLLYFTTKTLYQHYFQPILLCITHVAVLGFITSIIFGSIYQMHSVIFGVNIYNEAIAKISFGSLALGIILLCTSFFQFSIGLTCQLGALFTLIAFILFAINFFLATRKSTANHLEIEIISTAVIWLLATGVLGVLLVFNFTYVFIPKSHLDILTIHAHLGFAGWILLVIIGVSSRIIPMFYLAENTNQNPLKFSFYLINAGLLLLSISIYADLPIVFRIISALLLSLGILFFLFFLIKAFYKRNRKHLDIGLNLTTISFFFLIAVLPIGIILSLGIPGPATTITLSILYGILFIIGFCGTIITGQALKIIPFMLWVNKYQHLVGKMKTPLPKDLIVEKIAQWMMYLFLGGVLALCISFLLKFNTGIKISAISITIASILFNYNIFHALFFKTGESKTN